MIGSTFQRMEFLICVFLRMTLHPTNCHRPCQKRDLQLVASPQLQTGLFPATKKFGISPINRSVLSSDLGDLPERILAIQGEGPGRVRQAEEIQVVLHTNH